MCCNFRFSDERPSEKRKGFSEGKAQEEEKSWPHPGVAGRGSSFHLPFAFCLLLLSICTQQAALFN